MVEFFKRRAYRKEVTERVNAVLAFYPGGVKQMTRNYPGLPDGIDGNFDGEISVGESALWNAGTILTNEIEALDPEDREAMRKQISTLDWELFKRVLRGEFNVQQGITVGTSFVALAMVVAEAQTNRGEVTDKQFKTFMSEVFGALEGKSRQERSSERMHSILDETLGPPPLTAGDDDTSEVYPSTGGNGELGDLNGIECKVRIVYTVTGYALVRLDDGRQITERRSLTQADIEQVPRESWEDCRFVNLHTRSGEIVSCLIYGSDNEVLGDRRAFWWALAKVIVNMTDVKAGSTRMSLHGLAVVHTAARGMWDTVVERAGSIEELRDEPMYVRNTHFDVISKLMTQAQNEAEKLGLEVCKAMVLAVQSEDDKLEAAAYQRFKRYLWREGEEPREFYAHDAVASAL